MAKRQEIASYPQKVQAIRSSGQNLRFYVYLPMPLASALNIAGGEEVEWKLLDIRTLHLVRRRTAPARTTRKR